MENKFLFLFSHLSFLPTFKISKPYVTDALAYPRSSILRNLGKSRYILDGSRVKHCVVILNQLWHSEGFYGVVSGQKLFR